MPKKENRGKVLVVWIGDPLLYHEKVRNFVDMFRYDRCYPVSEFAPTTESYKGWCLFFQPYQVGLSTGFTIGRWNSFGAGICYEFERSSMGGEWLSTVDQQALAGITADLKARQQGKIAV